MNFKTKNKEEKRVTYSASTLEATSSSVFRVLKENDFHPKMLSSAKVSVNREETSIFSDAACHKLTSHSPFLRKLFSMYSNRDKKVKRHKICKTEDML